MGVEFPPCPASPFPVWKPELGFYPYSRSDGAWGGGDFLWNFLEPSSCILSLDAMTLYQVMIGLVSI